MAFTFIEFYSWLSKILIMDKLMRMVYHCYWHLAGSHSRKLYLFASLTLLGISTQLLSVRLKRPWRNNKLISLLLVVLLVYRSHHIRLLLLQSYELAISCYSCESSLLLLTFYLNCSLNLLRLYEFGVSHTVIPFDWVAIMGAWHFSGIKSRLGL
jgi:hypothetical protein